MGRLYFDHNISHDLGPLLWSVGHDLVFSRDDGTSMFTDDTLMLLTVQIDRILITHNRKDFKMLHDAWLTWPAAFGMALPPHPGIIVLDQAPPAMLAQVLAAFLADTPPERLVNGIFWWRRHAGWQQPTARAGWEPYLPNVEPERQ